MERRSFIRHAGIGGVLAAGVAPAVHAQATIRWRLASSFPKSLDTIYGAAEVMANIRAGLAKRTVPPADVRVGSGHNCSRKTSGGS